MALKDLAFLPPYRLASLPDPLWILTAASTQLKDGTDLVALYLFNLTEGHFEAASIAPASDPHQAIDLLHNAFNFRGPHGALLLSGAHYLPRQNLTKWVKGHGMMVHDTKGHWLVKQVLPIPKGDPWTTIEEAEEAVAEAHYAFNTKGENPPAFGPGTAPEDELHSRTAK